MAEKLKFLKVRAKNFRSISNMGMDVDLTAAPTTLVASLDNGAGKSTLILWAIYFALFGKPYGKECKIGGLVNSRSGKDCITEVEFQTKGSQWLVRRGYKPAVFDIYRDGKRIEDEAAMKDYQAYLLSIIGMDEKAFANIVGLGVDKFVPFAQMGAAERRVFVEQMLDMLVFARMNELAKAELKDVILKRKSQVDYDIAILQNNVDNRRRMINTLTDQLTKKSGEIGKQIEGLKPEIDSRVNMIAKFEAKVKEVEKECQELDVSEALSKGKTLQMQFQTNIDGIANQINAFLHLNECPTCKQEVKDEHKQSITGNMNVKKGELEASKAKLDTKVAELEETNGKRLEKIAEGNKLQTALNTLKTALEGFKQQETTLVSLLQSGDEQEAIERENEALSIDLGKLQELEVESTTLSKQEQDHKALLLMLKDDAAKAVIIKQYIPFLNQKINEFLDALNLYIQFTMDEEFNVSMYAPDRKGQTLGNLSTGQLCRVNLAVLLAWREVGRSKASVDCSLLVLDDVLNEVSREGVTDFMELWETKFSDKGINLFVITQRKDDFESLFDRCLTYALKDDTTVLLEE